MSCLWEVLIIRCSYVRSHERLSEVDRYSARKIYWFSILNRYESQLLNTLTNRCEAIFESSHWMNWKMNIWTNKKVMLYFASVLISHDSRNTKSSIEILIRFFDSKVFYRNSSVETSKKLLFSSSDRNRNIESILQEKSTCKSLRNWREHTLKWNLHWFEYFEFLLHSEDFANVIEKLNIKIIFTTIESNHRSNKRWRIVRNINTN